MAGSPLSVLVFVVLVLSLEFLEFADCALIVNVPIKAGISMATKLFAVRLAEFNIPVYEIRPGIIQTDMTSVKEKYWC